MSLLEHSPEAAVLHVCDSDLDGASCRVVGQYLLEPKVKTYQPIHLDISTVNEYLRDNQQEVESYDIVLFSDLAPDKQSALQILEKDIKIVIADHHPTSYDELSNAEMSGYRRVQEYHYDITRSSVQILYDLLKMNEPRNNVLDEFVTLANTYDLFKTKSKNWRVARALHYSLMAYMDFRRQENSSAYDEFAKVCIKKFNHFPRYRFSPKELAKIKTLFESERKMLQKAEKIKQFRTDSLGRRYLYIELPYKVSFVCNKLLEKYKDIHYVVCYNTWRKDELKLSLRSRKGEMEVKPICEKFGGGGHAHACGIHFTDQAKLFYDFRNAKIHLI